MPDSFVLVVGSINEDLVVRTGRLPAPGETVTGGTFARFDGGKGANQAAAAARAGAHVMFVGAVGRDGAGDRALEALAESGVDVGAVQRLDGFATGVALIVVDERGENQIAVAPGANAAIDARTVDAAMAQASLPTTGVLLANLEIGDDALAATIDRASVAGLRPIVNPAPARDLPNNVLDRAPILTPNAGEARALSGEAEPAAAASALFDRTGAPVVVTLGSDGALVRDVGGERRYAALDVKPVDTTGAGDVFNGVLAASLACSMPLDLAVRRAIAGSGLAVSERGARKTVATSAAIEERMGEVRETS